MVPVVHHKVNTAQEFALVKLVTISGQDNIVGNDLINVELEIALIYHS